MYISLSPPYKVFLMVAFTVAISIVLAPFYAQANEDISQKSIAVADINIADAVVNGDNVFPSDAIEVRPSLPERPAFLPLQWTQEDIENLSDSQKAEFSRYLTEYAVFEPNTSIDIDSVKVTTDRVSYVKGDMINITLSWSSDMANGYADAHRGKTDNVPSLKTLLVIQDMNHVSCAESILEDIPITSFTKTFAVSAIKDCDHVIIAVRMSDMYGKELGRWDIDTQTAPIQEDYVNSWFLASPFQGGGIFFFLLILFALLYFSRKGKIPLVTIFFGVIVPTIFVTSFLLNVSSVHAQSQSYPKKVVVRFFAKSTTVSSGSSTSLFLDTDYATSCTASGAWSGDVRKLSWHLQRWSTGPLTSSKTYTVTCNGPGGPVSKSVTVVVPTPTGPTLSFTTNQTSTSPGDQEATVWYPDYVQESLDLYWSTTKAASCTASGDWSGSKGTSGSFHISAPIYSKKTYTLTCTGPGGSITQTIHVFIHPYLTDMNGLVYSLSVNPQPVPFGSFSAVSWLTYGNITNCYTSFTPTGSTITSPTTVGPITANKGLWVMCVGEDYGGYFKGGDTIIVQGTPILSFSSDAASVLGGGSTTLRWEATNVTSCTASNGWGGSRGISGSESTGPLTTEKTYHLDCTGPNGSISRDVMVGVIANAPTLTFYASPTTVYSGFSSTLYWWTTNATSCTASADWSGTKGVSGSESTGPLTANKSYTLTCVGPGGTTTGTATVSVSALPPLPSVSLTANPIILAKGGSSVLTWAVTNADTCVAGGSWSGSKNAATGTHSETRSSIMSDQEYVLDCTNVTGTSTAIANVYVSQCSDGVDNDGNGYADMADSGCSNSLDNDESSVTACSDNLDNDGDGQIDMADVGCSSSLDNSEQNEGNTQCSDGIDNDGDGLVDYPNDTGCVNGTDNREYRLGDIDYSEF